MVNKHLHDGNKASQAQAEAGTDNDTFMTPLRTAQAINELVDGVSWGALTGTLADQTDLQNALNDKAEDNAVVKLTGDQSIQGSKTFSDRALLPFVNSGNLGATQTFSFASTQAYRGTLDANTTITVSNLADGQRASVHLYFSGAQRTIAWSGVDLWLEGEEPTAPDSGEVLVVTLLNDGVNVIGSHNIARSVI